MRSHSRLRRDVRPISDQLSVTLSAGTPLFSCGIAHRRGCGAKGPDQTRYSPSGVSGVVGGAAISPRLPSHFTSTQSRIKSPFRSLDCMALARIRRLVVQKKAMEKTMWSHYECRWFHVTKVLIQWFYKVNGPTQSSTHCLLLLIEI